MGFVKYDGMRSQSKVYNCIIGNNGYFSSQAVASMVQEWYLYRIGPA